MRISDWSSDVCSSDLVEGAVAGEGEARAEVVAAADLGLGAENHLQVAERGAVEARPRHLGAGAVLASPGVGEVDPAVLGDVGMESDVEQAALAAGHHLRTAEPGRRSCGERGCTFG